MVRRGVMAHSGGIGRCGVPLLSASGRSPLATRSRYGQRVFSADLQALTDDVANRLGAPTVLEDDEQRMVAYSSHSAPTDHVRRDSILRKETQPAIRDWFRKYGIVAATEPLRIPCDRELGILGRLCVPVRNHGLLMGFLWLIDDEETLDPPAVKVAEQSAQYAGQLMYEELLAERLGSSMLSHLLSPSEELRQLAAEQVTTEGLLSPGWEVVVAVVKCPARTVSTPRC